MSTFYELTPCYAHTHTHARAHTHISLSALAVHYDYKYLVLHYSLYRKEVAIAITYCCLYDYNGV